MKTRFFSPTPLKLTVAFIVVIIVIFVFSAFYYSNRKEFIRNDYSRELTILTDSKIRRIESWRKERIGDASVISNNNEFIPHIKNFFNGKIRNSEKHYVEKYLGLFLRYFDYADVILVDTSLQVRFSAAGKTERIGTPTQTFILEAFKTGKPYFSNLYQSQAYNGIFINIIAPLTDSAGFVGAVVLRVNPFDFLFPFIEERLPNENTSETLMFFVEGDEIVSLNELRHKKNTTLKLRAKINEENSELIAVKTIRGKEGLNEGVDYRGERVLADSRKIKDSPWYLISKIDLNELYEPLNDEMIRMGFATGAILLLFGLGIAWVESNRKKTLQIIKLKEEAQRLALLKHFEHLVKYANDMIVLSDENMNIIEANDRALDTYGYTKEELSKITLQDFITPQSVLIHESEKVPDSRLKDGLVYETVHKKKNGSTFLVEVSLRMIEVSGGSFYQRIIRDITERKKAEKALVDSEHKYRRLYESMADGFIIVDMNGVCTEFNSAYKNMLGYSVEELSRLTYKDITPEKWHHLEQSVLSDQFYEKGFSGVYEKEYRRKNGTVFPVEIRTYLLKDESGNNSGMWAIVRDITERKKAEEELMKSEEKFSKIFHLSTHAFALTDPEDGTVLEVNGGFTETMGYTPEDVIGKKMTETGVWAHPEHRLELLDKLKKGIPVRAKETLFRKKNGEEIIGLYNAEIISINDKPVMIGNFADITELKRSEEKFSSLFHFSPFAITLSDPDTSVFVDVNEGFTEVTGYSREEVIGKSALNLNLWANTEDRNFVRNELAKGKQITGMEMKLRRKSGEIFIGYFFAGTISVNNKRVMFTSLSDITDLKKAEEEIVKLNHELEQRVADRTRQLEEANKELEAFSYSVSHDLRSPLRSIDGFSLALFEDFYEKIGDEGKDYIERIRNAARRMDELIDGMLKLSRVTRYDIKFEDTDISAIVREIADDLTVTNKDNKAEFTVKDNVSGYCDPYLIRILLGNLLGNAWKYSSKNELIKIEFGTFDREGETVYFIKDNGAGFDMTYYNKLFGAFQRLHTSKEYQGTGIGLATALRIVHRHGGEIWAEGEVGKGATFYFTLKTKS